jgi:flagellar biosynthesis/type III secretory pathway protein FliH
MTDAETHAAGEAKAQAFHDGMERGMRAGADLMRDAVVERFEKYATESELYKGLFRSLAEEVRGIDPFKLYDPNH